MKMTEQEQLAWQRAEQARIDAERMRCTSPVTPANPVQQRQRVSTLRGAGLPSRSHR